MWLAAYAEEILRLKQISNFILLKSNYNITEDYQVITCSVGLLAFYPVLMRRLYGDSFEIQY